MELLKTTAHNRNAAERHAEALPPRGYPGACAASGYQTGDGNANKGICGMQRRNLFRLDEGSPFWDSFAADVRDKAASGGPDT